MADNQRGGRRRRKRQETGFDFDPNKIYLQGQIIESLPGTRFKVRVKRSANLEDLIIDCQVKTLFKVRRITMIKGDSVTVELDPSEDLTKGTIVMLHRSFGQNAAPQPQPKN